MRTHYHITYVLESVENDSLSYITKQKKVPTIVALASVIKDITDQNGRISKVEKMIVSGLDKKEIQALKILAPSFDQADIDPLSSSDR